MQGAASAPGTARPEGPVLGPLARLLQPRSVAVIGASADPAKTSGRPVEYLQRHGYQGAIYPVNPRYEQIRGLACYARLEALPAVPDVGLVLLGAERAQEAVRGLAALGTPACIVLAGGYAEAGAQGAARQAALKAAAGPMRLLGPNTIGLVNVIDGITLSASGALEAEALAAGPIALVSQSGGIFSSLLSRAASAGVGLSRLLATGNEADIDVCDCLEYLLTDEATRVIALYIESLRDPPRFRALAARAAALGKPLVAYKVGRSEPGARAAVSHTGAIAGADRMYEALFRQAGVIRARQFSELLDIPAALALCRPLAGRRIALVTSTGGAATLVTDNLGLQGFEVPDPSAQTAARLAAIGPDADWSLEHNPFDVTLAGFQPDILREVFSIVLQSPDYDALIVVVGASALRHPEVIPDAIDACRAVTLKPILAYISPAAPALLSLLNRRGVPAFQAPEACAAALAALASRPAIPLAVQAVSGISGPAAEAAAGALVTRSGLLDEQESRRLFAAFGIGSVREFALDSAAQAAAWAGSPTAEALGETVVLKVRSARIAHKSDMGGVRLGVRRERIGAEAAAMIGEVLGRSGQVPEGLLVQEQVSGAIEVLLGFRHDPQLGPAIVLGAGGVLAEWIDALAIRLLPLSEGDAAAMIDELRLGVLLAGVRGRPASDRAALEQAIEQFAAMALALGGRLLEAEINPLFVLPGGGGVRAADGLVLLA
jgi:acetate---CoA ligase (ADP-forming)